MLSLAALLVVAAPQAEPTAILYPGSVTWPAFGSAVAIDGNSLIVGAIQVRPCCNERGEASIFTRPNPNEAWVHEVTYRTPTGRNFGREVAIEGDFAAATEFPDDDATVVVAERIADAFQFTETLTYPGQSALDPDYGDALAFADGRLLVSASGARDGTSGATGVVYVYELVGGAWTLTQRLLPPLGRTGQIPLRTRFGKSMGADGDLLAIGAPNADPGGMSNVGQVHIFRWDPAAMPNARYVTVASIDAPPLDDQQGFGGFGIDLSAGRVAAASSAARVAGIEEAGCVHIFEDLGSGWAETARLHDPAPSERGRFGFELSLSVDRLVVGREARARRQLLDLPLTVEVFEASAGAWAHTQTIADPIEADANGFGEALSLDGATLAVGMPGATVRRDDRGACYVGDVTLGWKPVATGACGGELCACPGRALQGCGNSELRNATLHAIGSTSISADDLEFTAAFLPPNAITRLVLGPSVSPPRVFGDGVLCVGDPRTLAPAAANSLGFAVIPSGLVARAAQELGAAGIIAAGESWVFQAMYAHTNGLFGCTTNPYATAGGNDNGRPYLVARGFHLTNALQVTFTP